MKNEKLRKKIIEGISFIKEDDIDEIKLEETDEESTEEEIPSEEEETLDTEVEDVDPDPESTIQSSLQQALKAAKQLGDGKLVDQIGNTFTFFTRAYIVGDEEMSNEPSPKEMGMGKDIELEEESVDENQDIDEAKDIDETKEGKLYENFDYARYLKKSDLFKFDNPISKK